MKTYVIVEDDIITSMLIARKIEAMPDRKVTGSATGENIAFDLIQKLSPDFVLTDIDLQQGNGISLINRIRIVDNDTKFLIMTGYDMNFYRKNLYSMKGVIIAPKPIFNLDLHLDLLEKI